MIVGIVGLVVGNIFVWQSDVETTQFFTGWIIGVLCLIGSVSLPRIPRSVLAGVGAYFILTHEQKLTTPSTSLECVHGVERYVGGEYKCVCNPPYSGLLCDECPPGAILEDGSTVDNPICKTCKHQYMFPFCRELLPGYITETHCRSTFVSSCSHPTPGFLRYNEKTYPNAPLNSVRDQLYNTEEDFCLNNSGTVYCDKCIENHAGPDCCPDGYYGQNCKNEVPVCAAKLDYGASLKENVLPVDFGLADPEICYSLDDETCTCGGEFIGDSLCASFMCVDGKCADTSRVTDYQFRCDCDVGVGPDCETPTCYGGTRMWKGDRGVCECNAQHLDSYNGRIFDACNIQVDGKCYPGLFGDECIECQCVVDISNYQKTKQCEKNMYGVFDRDFRTKEYTGQCIDSGICTNEPDDCGVVEKGADRCLLFTNPDTFSAILFSGDNCTNSEDSKCRKWEPCQV